MILDDLNRNSTKSRKANEFKQSFDRIKDMVVKQSFDAIDPVAVNREKQKIISTLNNCEDENMFDQFEELAFYQERYGELEKFLAQRSGSKKGIHRIDQKELVANFQKSFSITDELTSQNALNINKEKGNMFREANSEIEQPEPPKFPQLLEIPEDPKMQKLSAYGLGSPIFNFFQKKQRELRRVGFKDLIDKKDKSFEGSNRTFKKKIKKPAHDLELRKLLEQNKRLHQLIQKKSLDDNELNEFQKNVLREEKERCMKRIEQLEDEVEELAKNNYKYKEMQKSNKIVSTFVNDSMRDREIHAPYYLSVRPNDLKKIQKKSPIKMPADENRYILAGLNDVPPIEKQQSNSFDMELDMIANKPVRADQHEEALEDLLEEEESPVKQKNLFIGPNEMKWQRQQARNPEIVSRRAVEVHSFVPPEYKVTNQSIDRGSRFDSFSIANTAYNNSSLFLNASKNLASIDSVTSTRNKVAFFKKSLVIVRDENIQIAFKKSDMNVALQRLRLIFYINNKTNRQLGINIEYDYETHQFIVETTEKATAVGRKSQAREVIEVSLPPSCQNINSVIDAHFTVGDKRYDLWVPACFIQWSEKPLIDTAAHTSMVVQPDRQFSNFTAAKKVLNLSQPISSTADEQHAYLYGRSKFGPHEIKISWWEKQLTIEAEDRILDFLAFIMHHFK